VSPDDSRFNAGERISVLVPELNERTHLAPCLDGLLAEGPEVAEILVIDGGSTDGTQSLATNYAARHPRPRLVVAGPAPLDWNGNS